MRQIRNRSVLNIIVLAAAAVATGCATALSKPEKTAMPEPAEPATEIVTKEVVLDAGTLFAFDSDQLTSEGRASLDALLRDAGDRSAGPITVTGHADRIGPEEYNMNLSERRARSVADYLVQQGAPADSIETFGRGETEPVVQCEDQPWRALVECLAPNRRVVVEYPTTVEEEVTVDN